MTLRSHPEGLVILLPEHEVKSLLKRRAQVTSLQDKASLSGSLKLSVQSQSPLRISGTLHPLSPLKPFHHPV